MSSRHFGYVDVSGVVGVAWVVAAALALSGCEGAAMSEVDGAGEAGEPRNTFYVSLRGDGSDGRSWATAWPELNAIDWTQVGAGDLILIDGGDASMTYKTTLKLGRSGAPREPIVIRVSDEPGHDGLVVLHGGRDSVLPACGQKDFVRQPDDEVLLRGIDTNGQSWVIIDGGRWRGMRLTAFGGPAVEVTDGTEHITFRHLDVTDNGAAAWRPDGTWYPFGAGVRLAGNRILMERSLVHDNGGSALRIEGGLSNFKMSRSWLFNARPHPTEEKEPFNVCAQPNGVHVAPIGEHQSGFVVEDSIVGPGFATGLLLSDAKVLGEWAVMSDVLVKNTILVSHHGESATANVSAMQPPGHSPRNWRFERVTSIRPDGAPLANVAVRGKGHTIVDSYFVGGGELWFEEPTIERSCRSSKVTGVEVGETADPLYEKLDYSGVGETFADFDLSFDEDSPCLGVGATITSVAMLMSDEPIPAEPIVIPNVGPTVEFLMPTPTTAIIEGEPVGLIARASDPDGKIARVEFLADGTLIGAVTQAPYTLAWKPTAGIVTLTARAVDDDDAVAEAIIQVQAGGTPKVSFEAESGTLANGFEAVGGCVRQTTTTTTVGTGGTATYTFNIPAAGTYVVKAMVSAPSDSENSFFFNIDAAPTGTAIWDLAISATPIEQIANWRGNGTGTAPEFSPKTFTLAEGEHTLTLQGREANACIDRITIELLQ